MKPHDFTDVQRGEKKPEGTIAPIAKRYRETIRMKTLKCACDQMQFNMT